MTTVTVFCMAVAYSVTAGWTPARLHPAVLHLSTVASRLTLL